jgi:hypothetical protein
MKYILDANVALKWVIPEKHSDKAIRLRSDYQAGIHELHAPDIFPVEAAHALTRAERKGDIPVEMPISICYTSFPLLPNSTLPWPSSDEPSLSRLPHESGSTTASMSLWPNWKDASL